MTPFCPACRKRVEVVRSPVNSSTVHTLSGATTPRVDLEDVPDAFIVWYTPGGDPVMRLMLCSECGAFFDGVLSERLAPKCSCGADLDMPPSNTLTWTAQMPTCEKCRKERP